MCNTDGMTPREAMDRVTVRIPRNLVEAVQAKADQNDEYLSEVIRQALESYVKTDIPKEETK